MNMPLPVEGSWSIQGEKKRWTELSLASDALASLLAFCRSCLDLADGLCWVKGESCKVSGLLHFVLLALREQMMIDTKMRL